ncbi:MAG TPA: hypothetical protein PKV71_11785 [Calditrichia bacterium]|nr:hypothetical protein [Calditrichia bacterium]
MKKNKARILMPVSFLLAILMLKIGVSGTPQGDPSGESSHVLILTFLEVPFLVLCVVFAFMTAHAMKGGRFGQGMLLLAWGFVIMAVGHIHMQIDHFWGYNLLVTLLGAESGYLAWVITLVATWLLSGLGFYQIYKACSGD